MSDGLNDMDIHRLLLEQGHKPTFVPKKARKPRDNEEWRIQSNFFRWWRAACAGLGIWPGCMWHVPNGSMLGDSEKSRMIRSKMLNLAGMWGGVVDVFGMIPVGPKHGIFIEFKKPSLRTAKNGGLSKEQQEFIGYALARGYHCAVCYSWEEGRDTTLNYLKL